MDEIAVTPRRKLAPIPLFGLGWTDQSVPFQRRISVWVVPPSSKVPTAQAAHGPAAATSWIDTAIPPTCGGAPHDWHDAPAAPIGIATLATATITITIEVRNALDTWTPTLSVG